MSTYPVKKKFAKCSSALLGVTDVSSFFNFIIKTLVILWRKVNSNKVIPYLFGAVEWVCYQ